MYTVVFNPEMLDAWEQVDPDSWRTLVAQILDVFTESADEKRIELKDAVLRRDWQAVKDISHSLKSSFGNVGGEALFLMLGAIEAAALKDPEQALIGMKNFDTLYCQTMDYLSEYRKQRKI